MFKRVWASANFPKGRSKKEWGSRKSRNGEGHFIYQFAFPAWNFVDDELGTQSLAEVFFSLFVFVVASFCLVNNFCFGIQE